MSPGPGPRKARSDRTGSKRDGPSEPAGFEADSLAEYRRKRDPLATNEPFGAEREHSGSATRAGRFVVHLHRARARHFDLRLQMGRSLKSFAVPRGPSLDPDERRLAVLTEDHPLEYADFEDVIPEGNYGAGPMIAWDVGRVAYLENDAEIGVEKGKIDFLLFGHKLGGRFALVRTKRGGGKEWLLIKKQDAHARKDVEITEASPRSVLSGLTVDELEHRAEIATEIAEKARSFGAPERELSRTAFEPMSCALEGATLSDAERLYELKLDGVRIVAEKEGHEVRLRYRNGRVCSGNYAEVQRAVETLPVHRCVLDGEVVAFDAEGRPRFQRLGSRIQARTAIDMARAQAQTPIVYLAFDLIAVEGFDLSGLALSVRKRLLFELLRGKGLVRALDHIEAQGEQLFELCKNQGLEGVVAKRISSPYRFGPQRTLDWVKLKCDRDDDFVVVGYLAGKGSRGGLGALTLATYRGDALVYRGRVGSGFQQEDLERLLPMLEARAAPEASPFEPIPEDAKLSRWVRPDLVVRVRHHGYTDEGRLRAAVYLGVKDDVHPADCHAAPSAEELEAELSRAAEAQRMPEEPAIFVTNRDKVFFPEQGYTKGDLVAYYSAVADSLLPFLRERPVVLVRHPDGIHGKSFFQWNVPQGTPDWVRTLTLEDPEEPGRKKNVFLLDDLKSLLYVVNLGSIPIHVLACRASSREACDFITFDLDLGGQPFSRAVEVALSLREILSDLGLSGSPKTSGQGGLHVLVPMGAGVPFEAAKLLVELIGRLIVARHADFSTMERRVEKRGGKLYVDTGQTGPSRTIVAPYSVRARPGATVSTPLFWDELSGALDPSRFTLISVPSRIIEVGDPLGGMLDEQPNVGVALEKLERWVRRLPALPA